MSTTPPSPRTSRRAPAVIATVGIVLGGALVLGTVGAAVASSTVSAAVNTTARTVDVAGIDAIDVTVSAADLDVRFADVGEAQLEVTSVGGAERWTFERRDDTLVVSTPERFFGLWWFSGGNGRAVLTLPETLQRTGLDADLSLSAGGIDAAGTFADLDIEVSAGRLEVTGAANEVDVDLSAGRADLDLADVSTADLQVSAGTLVTRLTGAAPRSLGVNLSAGSARLTLPDAEYAVAVDVSAGNMDNSLATSSSAPRKITGTVSAGNLVLRPGR